MYKVLSYQFVRHAVFIEGLSKRQAATRSGNDPRMIRTMSGVYAPPGYRRTKTPAQPKPDPFSGVMDAIISADQEVADMSVAIRGASW